MVITIEQLENTIETILERMYFSVGEKVDIDNLDFNTVQIENKLFYMVETVITGDLKGKLIFYLADSFAHKLTQNVTGSKNFSESEERIIDNLKEFANIISGYIFTTYYNEGRSSIEQLKCIKAPFDPSKLSNNQARWQVFAIDGDYLFYCLN